MDFDENDIELVAQGQLVRVRWISEDKKTFGLELRNGNYGWGTSTQPTDLRRGQVCVFHESGQFTTVAEAMWPTERFVAVVRLRGQNETILDVNGALQIVPTVEAVQYDVGNTVEAGESGVRRVIAESPVRSLDHVDIDDVFIRQFLHTPSARAETFDDFGGNDDIVKRANELVEILLNRNDELVEIGARPIKGVLFTGEPGTGKTMLARIIANHSGATFYEISGPEVVSKWVGQSEEVLRKMFEHAASQEKSVIFFDEIDSVAPRRKDDGQDSSNRFVAQLLTLMDGFSPDHVLVIATTNRPQDIDPALRRTGRFDWELKFSPPASVQDRISILTAAGARIKQEPDLPHRHVADRTDGWTPADLAGIWREAALLAVGDLRKAVSPEDYVGGFQRMYVRWQQGSGTRTGEAT